MQRPVVILSGDFAQQQPIGTVDGLTKQVPSITTCSHCMSYVNLVRLTEQFRTKCPRLLSFLHHIRYQKPTVDMLNNIFEERILCTEECVDETIYDSL